MGVASVEESKQMEFAGVRDRFLIITPTFQRPASILKRCLDSVRRQSLQNWHQIVVIDDSEDNQEQHVSDDLIKEYSSDKCEFKCLGYHSKNWGNSPRKFALDHLLVNDSSGKLGFDYVVWLDDDNVVFPNWLREMANCHSLEPEVDLVICKIFYNGPLRPNSPPNEPPVVLSGDPPVVGNIDTLQIAVRAQLMMQTGWSQIGGYCADAVTIKNLLLGGSVRYCSHILGCHL